MYESKAVLWALDEMVQGIMSVSRKKNKKTTEGATRRSNYASKQQRLALLEDINVIQK